MTRIGATSDLARVARGAAAVLGAVLLFDSLAAIVNARVPSALWIDLRWAGASLGLVISAALGAGLMSGAVTARARKLGACCGVALSLHAARDAVRCIPVVGVASFSSFLAIAAAMVAVGLLAECREAGRARTALGLTLGAATLLIALPLAQIGGAARASYERPADAVVVLGARVYSNGSPSLALYDRVRTGCDLVKRGFASKLIVSGGPGDGPTDEPHAMRAVAIACGVDPASIEMDDEGLTTARTAENAAHLVHRGSRVLVVSHAYHLARARIAFEREGVVPLMVPAKETRTLVRLPYYVAREVPGFWAYYLL